MSWTRANLRVAAALVVGIATISSGRATSASWHDAAATATFPKNASIIAMTCPGIALCFAVGGYATGRGQAGTLRGLIAQTKDGATSWTIQYLDHRRLSSFFSGVACPSTMQCYVTGGYAQDGSGQTWRMLPGTDILARSGVGQAFDHAMSIACPSARVCYTADGDPEGECGGCPAFGAIFGTQDGGTHWRLLYLRRKHDYLWGPIVCPSASVCYAMGTTRLSVLRDEFILSTKNAGQTWTKHMVPAGLALACPSIDVCYSAALTGPTIFRTTDGGTTWQTLP